MWHWQLFSGNEQSIRDAMWSTPWATKLHSAHCVWGFQVSLYKPKSAEGYVVFRDPSVKCCDFVHMLGCLFLFATACLVKYHGTHVCTPLTGGTPGIPLPLYNPDLFSAFLPYVQVLAGLMYPAQLCYNIQQPFMAMNITLVRYIMNGWIEMHKMM